MVWRDGRRGPRLAVIHRPKRDDWRLPKGKLKRGEDFRAAAMREVAEETGCRARVLEFAGYTLDLEKEHPKLVLFWHMKAEGRPRFEPNEEVDRVDWLEPREALDRIEHADERRLIRSVALAHAANRIQV